MYLKRKKVTNILIRTINQIMQIFSVQCKSIKSSSDTPIDIDVGVMTPSRGFQ